MNIVRVIPVSRSLNREELSYFSAGSPEVGRIVSVPLRSSTVPAIVLSVEPAAQAKTDIKSAHFSLKKLGNVKGTSFFLPSIVQASKELSLYFATTTGAVLYAITPKVILDELPQTPAHSESVVFSNLKHEPQLVQARDEERFTFYKSVVRESFSKKQSVFLCVPEMSMSARAHTQLCKGIERHTYMLHASLTRKQILETWRAALKDTHPVLLIATPGFLSFPREDMGALIVEKENARSYTRPDRPFFDMRECARTIARVRGMRYICGDILLRTETLFKHESGEYASVAPFSFRFLSGAEQHIIDLKQYKDFAGTKKFQLISEELATLIKETLLRGEHMFIFTARRGLFPLTVCSDCGTVTHCPHCGATLVLHSGTKGDVRTWLCHACKTPTPVQDRCEECGSWRLTTLGIGNEHTHDLVRELTQNEYIFRIDRDATKTPARASKVCDAFYSAPGGILLGTEMALPYLDRTLHHTAIASLDALFAIPDFHMHDRIANIVLSLREKAEKTFLIQTRFPDLSVFKHVVDGNITPLYREEIADRKTLNFPPFTTLIKVSAEGTRERVRKEIDMVCYKLAEYKPEIFPAYTKGTRGKQRLVALIRLPRGQWVDTALLAHLRSLPHSITITIDPETIL